MVGGQERLSTEMKAWKLEGQPVVGWWVHVGDVETEEGSKLDWMPFKEGEGKKKGKEFALPLSELGNYVSLQIPGGGFIELGVALPEGVETQHRNQQCRVGEPPGTPS